MAQPISGGVYTMLFGTGMLLAGYLIKYRQWTGLISETTAVVSPSSSTAPIMASIVGNATLVAGAVVVLFGGLDVLGLVSNVPEWVQLAVLVGAVFLIAPRLGINEDPA